MQLENNRIKFKMGNLHVQIVKVFDMTSFPEVEKWTDAGWEQVPKKQMNMWMNAFVNFGFLPEDFILRDDHLAFEKSGDMRHVNIFHRATDEEIQSAMEEIQRELDRLNQIESDACYEEEEEEEEEEED